MSIEHYLARLHIQETIRKRYPPPQGEVTLETHLGSGDTAGRADVAVQLADGPRLCIEVQRSSMSAHHLQTRNQKRQDAGWAIDWVFVLERDHIDWSTPISIDGKLETALELRGYIYVLDDPHARDPVLRVIVHPDLNRFIPRMRGGGTLTPLPRSRAHALDIPRPLREFSVTDTRLHHAKLHAHLERWLRDALEAFTPPPLTAPEKTADTVHAWQQRRDVLTRDLGDATVRVRRADDTLRGSQNEQRMAQASPTQTPNVPGHPCSSSGAPNAESSTQPEPTPRTGCSSRSSGYATPAASRRTHTQPDEALPPRSPLTTSSAQPQSSSTTSSIRPASTTPGPNTRPTEATVTC